MKNKRIKTIFVFCTVLLLFPAVGFGLDNETGELLTKVVVNIMPLNDYNPDTKAYIPGFTMGSGTIIDSEFGLILTNYHVVGQMQDFWPFKTRPLRYHLIRANTPRKGDPPAPAFIAEFITGNIDLDLAVLKITAQLDTAPFSRDNLPALEWGTDEHPRTVNEIFQTEDVIVMGFPSYGTPLSNLTLNVTRGYVAGFENELHINGPTAWIKTDAKIAHGNSGGLAIDIDGRFIGVPTQVAFDASGEEVMEIQGKLRAADHADFLIEKVRSKGKNGSWGDLPKNLRVPYVNKEPDFSTMDFSIEVDKEGYPVNFQRSFEGQPAAFIVARASYQNLPYLSQVGVSWNHNGQEAASYVYYHEGDSLTGEIYLSLGDNTTQLPYGMYDVHVSIDGEPYFSSSVSITQDSPTSNEIPAGASRVQLKGKIYDADTTKGIPGARIFFLDPGITVSDFIADPANDKLLAQGVSGISGKFIVEPDVFNTKSYNVVVYAEAYEVIGGEIEIEQIKGGYQYDIGGIALSKY